MIKELFALSGRVALITGGSKGLGKAIARGFAEAGADVAICSRNEDELKQAATKITQGLDIRCEYRVADMTDRSDVDGLAEWVLQSFEQVDILVNNAGANIPQDLVETTDETWDHVVELNLTSCMRLARSLAPQMIEHGWGRIIHMSSILALTSIAARGVYSSTKAALIGMARAHAMELGPHGITVNCIAPGPIMTDLSMSMHSEERKKLIADAAALKCWGDPIDVAGPALMLASEAGRYITGAVIVVDGGVICRAFD